MLDSECSMFLKRSDRASRGASGTSGMFLSDAYVGGAAACDEGGWGVPKSRGAGDDERDCEVRDVRSFMRLVLRTWRNCSVISAANLSVSILWCAERWALLL